REQRTCGIETRIPDTLRHGLAPVPPLHGFGDTPLQLGIESEDLGEVAQRAARAVHDDCRGDRRPLAAVLAIDVLNDFLAPLVLEVDIDVRRLIALTRDEALEE